MHRFDVAAAAWTNLTASLRGHPPGARVGAGLAAASGRVLVYGGYDEAGGPIGRGVVGRFEGFAVFDDGESQRQDNVFETDALSSVFALGGTDSREHLKGQKGGSMLEADGFASGLAGGRASLCREDAQHDA